MKILALQNCAVEGFGLYRDSLQERCIETVVVRADRTERLPDVEEFDAVLIGGTPISANESEVCGFLQRERLYLQRALALTKPCFGICCGAQLLAKILGAEVNRCSMAEIGCHATRLTEAGAADPLLAGFPEVFEVFQWHADMFALAEGATLLVEGSDVCRNQLFRRDNIVGVQFHLEITAAEAGAFADAYPDELAWCGADAG